MFFFCCLMTCDGNYWLTGFLSGIGPLVTSSTVVTLFQSFDVYDELQSWEVAYIIWGFSFFILCAIEPFITWSRGGKEHEQEVGTYWNSFLLKPFGIQVSSDGNTSMWSFTLVSLFPSIVGGYIANFLFDQKYEMECGTDIISSVCFDANTCCTLRSSHRDWYLFLPNIASSMVAAWGIIKITASILISTDDEIQNQIETPM
eukprot:897193_1